MYYYHASTIHQRLGMIKVHSLGALCGAVLLFCGPAWAETAESLEKQAMARDYQAQRNLAYAYQMGRLGLNVDFMKACMWRTVIVLSGNSRVDASDASNVDFACGRLSQTERVAAVRQGEVLAEKLYTRRR